MQYHPPTHSASFNRTFNGWRIATMSPTALCAAWLSRTAIAFVWFAIVSHRSVSGLIEKSISPASFRCFSLGVLECTSSSSSTHHRPWWSYVPDMLQSNLSTVKFAFTGCGCIEKPFGASELGPQWTGIANGNSIRGSYVHLLLLL